MDFKINEQMTGGRLVPDEEVDSLGGEARGTLMRGALREMRVRMSGDQPTAPMMPRTNARLEELSQLRERILRNVEHNELLQQAQAAPPPPSSYRPQQQPARNDFSSIMALPPPTQRAAEPDLRGSYAQQEADDMQYYEEQQWSEPAPQLTPQPRRQNGYSEPLLSGHAEAATEQAFRRLSDTLMQRAAGDLDLDGMARDMLRGMIKQWLDTNLATLVEGLVREEIERVARRGR